MMCMWKWPQRDSVQLKNHRCSLWVAATSGAEVNSCTAAWLWQQGWPTLTVVQPDHESYSCFMLRCKSRHKCRQRRSLWWWCGLKATVGLLCSFLPVLFPEGFVFQTWAWWGGPARPGPGQASPGSHRIPCPITGRRGLKRGRITLSQQTAGNRKTESAASRRSSQPSTISNGLIRLHLHLLHPNRSFRPGLVCPGFKGQIQHKSNVHFSIQTSYLKVILWGQIKHKKLSTWPSKQTHPEFTEWKLSERVWLLFSEHFQWYLQPHFYSNLTNFEPKYICKGLCSSCT